MTQFCLCRQDEFEKDIEIVPDVLFLFPTRVGRPTATALPL